MFLSLSLKTDVFGARLEMLTITLPSFPVRSHKVQKYPKILSSPKCLSPLGNQVSNGFLLSTYVLSKCPFLFIRLICVCAQAQLLRALGIFSLPLPRLCHCHVTVTSLILTITTVVNTYLAYCIPGAF